MKVLIIPEDQELDRYVIQPVIEALFNDSGGRARIEVLPEPRLRGAGEALSKETIRSIVEDNRMIDLFLLVVDRVLVRAAHEKSRKTYGSPRVHAELQANDVQVSKKRVARLMKLEGLKARARRRYKCTTNSDHDQPVAANLLARNFQADRPNQRWVGDATELYVPGGKLYLVSILDLFSRMLVGWAVSAVNDRHLAMKALDMALKRRCPGAGLLHHTDRGSPYASEDYQRALTTHGIQCSMSRRGNCLDNAAMESWHSTIKAELGERFASHADAKSKLFDYFEVFYNSQRRHSTLDYVSPMEYERSARMVIAA